MEHFVSLFRFRYLNRYTKIEIVSHKDKSPLVIEGKTLRLAITKVTDKFKQRLQNIKCDKIKNMKDNLE